jgi:hypothetical protein
MKIFTVAQECRECYGHGDYGTELRICREGFYGSGNFPPAFHTSKAAEDYIAMHQSKFSVPLKVVEMEFIIR